MTGGALLARARAAAERRGVEEVAFELAFALERGCGVLGLPPGRLGPEEAGRLYEQLLATCSASRKALGAFYTPQPVARAIARRLLADVDAGGPVPRIIDPACGTGAFLLAAARALRRRGVSPRAIGCALWGIDRDAGALALCRAALRAEGIAVPRDHLLQQDALLAPWPRAHFDRILGNPPFVNIVRLPAPQRQALKARYRSFRNKCDLYGLFVEAGIDHLALGGRLSFILSDSFLGTDSFAPLRRLLFASEARRVRRIDRLAGATFGAKVRAVVLEVEARPPDAAVPVALGRIDAAGRVEAGHALPHAIFRRRAARSAALPEDARQLAWAEALEAEARPLSDFLELSLGVKTGDDGRFVSPRRRGRSARRCVRGRDVGPFSITDRCYIDYRPERLRAVHGARPRRPESFLRPMKLLLRETSGARLIAAVDTEARIPLDTLHALYPRAEGPNGRSLHGWCALLNSAPLCRWYALHHPGPHVKAGEVRRLPVPPPRPEPLSARLNALPALAAYLAGAPWHRDIEAAPEAVLDCLGRWMSGHRDPRGQAAIDRLCAKLYGV